MFAATTPLRSKIETILKKCVVASNFVNFLQLYIPPSRNEEGENDEVEGRKSRKVGGKPLFKLEYSTVDGTIHSLLVSVKTNILHVFYF